VLSGKAAIMPYIDMKTKAFIFDFDDTLAVTDAMVQVMVNGKIVKTLDSHTYTSYQLQEDEEFCFAQFAQANHILNCQLLPLIEYAIQLSNEGHDLYILTARSPEVSEAIQDKLDENNVKVKIVFCVGGKPVNIADEKRKVLLTLIEKYDTIYFYDDDAANVHAANKIGIKANLVSG
jgi:FMN phosphatase YigB (HAD superfamily)